MDGKENQGQDRGRRRGKIPTPVLQWVEAQRRQMQDGAEQQQQPPPPPQPPPRHQQNQQNQQYQQYQQNQQYQQYQQNQQYQQYQQNEQQQQQQHHQLLQQQQPDLSLQFDSFANDFENFENLGPDGAWGYNTAIQGAAGTGQPQRGLPIVFPPPERRYYGYNAIRPLVFPPSPFGPSPPPPPYAFVNNGAGAPAMTPRGPPPVHRPILQALAGNQGVGQGAGAFGRPVQVAQAQGNRQSHNVAPRSVARPNEARNAPERTRQAGGEQPSRKRLADGKPRQPAAKKHAGGGATGKAPSEQPCTGHMQPTSQQPSTSASDHHLTISERLDRGLITDVAGLTREEENEVLLWARRQGMKWKDIHEKFKFQVALSTLRGRYRDLMHKGKPPKKAVFNELDAQLLLDAVPRIAGRRLDDVDDCNVKALWNKVKEYIRTNGGQTTAGSGTLKLKYIELTRGQAAAKAWKEAQKQKKGKTKGKAPNDGDAKDSEAQEETLQWKHEEYARYPVQGMEGADFGDSVNEEENGEVEEGDFESDEEDSQYDDEMEDDADFS